MSIRRFTRLTHGWIGVVLALFIVLVAGSGASLAFMSDMFLAQYGDMLRADAPADTGSPADLGAMIAAAERSRGDDFQATGVLMPHTRVPKVSTALVYGMEPSSDPDYPMMVSVDPHSGVAKGAFSLGDAFGHDLIDFHYELTMGETGAVFVAVLGLLLTAFAVSGIWLWWPRRRSLRAKLQPPRLRGRVSNKLFQLHGWLGVWASLLVVLFALSGTATVQPGWFGPLLADAHEAPPTGAEWSRDCGAPVGLAAATAQAAPLFPGRTLAGVYRFPGQPVVASFRAPGDLNTMEGDAFAWVHPSCPGIVEPVIAARLTTAERLDGMMFSLHGGYLFGPVAGPILVIATGLSLVFFSISGVWVFFTRTLRGRPRPRETRPRDDARGGMEAAE